jgi:hypothetical protein
MADKKLRILIAERCQTQSLVIERSLNRLGYYRIATADSLTEMHLLGSCTGPFDVLICNAWLLRFSRELQEPTSLAGVCRSALMYQSQRFPGNLAPLAPEGTFASLPESLGVANLSAFMRLVDPLQRSIYLG